MGINHQPELVIAGFLNQQQYVLFVKNSSRKVSNSNHSYLLPAIFQTRRSLNSYLIWFKLLVGGWTTPTCKILVQVIKFGSFPKILEVKTTTFFELHPQPLQKIRLGKNKSSEFEQISNFPPKKLCKKRNTDAPWSFFWCKDDVFSYIKFA